MENTRFPNDFGRMGGKTFIEVLEQEPDIIEFCWLLWQKNQCTGVFEKFKLYVDNKLKIESNLSAHEDRCISWVKNNNGKIPSYMLKYVDINDVAELL